MFFNKEKRYKITFDKRWKEYDFKTDIGKIVKDHVLLDAIIKLQKTYGFEIIKIEIKDYNSIVIFKTKKCKFYEIFNDFIQTIGDHITNIQFK